MLASMIVRLHRAITVGTVLLFAGCGPTSAASTGSQGGSQGETSEPDPITGSSGPGTETRCSDGREWRGAVLLDSAGANSPQVSVDLGGNAVAVWHQVDTDAPGTWARRYDAILGTWGEASLLASATWPTAASLPQLALDSDGNGIVVSQRTNEIATASIHANRYDASTARWDSARRLQPDGTRAGQEARVSMSTSGDATAVWRLFQADDEGDQIWSSRYDAGAETWGTAVRIDTHGPGTSAYGPQVGMDAGGNAMVVWGHLDDGLKTLWTNRYDADAGAWDESSSFSSGHYYAGGLDSVVAPNGEAFVVWSQPTTSDLVQVQVVHRPADAGTWTAVSILSSDEAASRPQIAFVPGGSAVAVWQEFDGGIQASWYDAETEAWGMSAQLVSGNRPRFPQVAVDPRGVAMLVWQEGYEPGEDKSVWANRYCDGAWGDPVQLGAGDAVGNLDPQLAIGLEGHAVVVWNNATYGLAEENVWANVYR